MFGIISKSPPLRRHPNLDGADTEGKAEQAAQTKTEAENGRNSATRQEEDVDAVQAERPLEEPRPLSVLLRVRIGNVGDRFGELPL